MECRTQWTFLQRVIYACWLHSVCRTPHFVKLSVRPTSRWKQRRRSTNGTTRTSFLVDRVKNLMMMSRSICLKERLVAKLESHTRQGHASLAVSKEGRSVLSLTFLKKCILASITVSWSCSAARVWSVVGSKFPKSSGTTRNWKHKPTKLWLKLKLEPLIPVIKCLREEF